MTDAPLGKRERQIMDVVWAMGRATAAEILERLDDPPSYSAVRGTLRVLVEKGLLRFESDGPRYVYHPAAPRRRTSRSALRRVVDTFFRGAPDEAMEALIDLSASKLSEEQLRSLEERVREARERKRPS